MNIITNGYPSEQRNVASEPANAILNFLFQCELKRPWVAGIIELPPPTEQSND